MTSAVFAFAIKTSSLLDNVQGKPLARLLPDISAYLQHRKLREGFRRGDRGFLYYIVNMRLALSQAVHDAELLFRQALKLFLQVNIFRLGRLVNAFFATRLAQLDKIRPVLRAVRAALRLFCPRFGVRKAP